MRYKKISRRIKKKKTKKLQAILKTHFLMAKSLYKNFSNIIYRKTSHKNYYILPSWY